jgi:hypothetical protein
MMVRSAVLSLVCAAGLTPALAQAAIANFTLTGQDVNAFVSEVYRGPNAEFAGVTFLGYADSGTVSFTYTGGPGAITLANLTNFSLSRTVNYQRTVIIPEAPQYNTFDDFGALYGYRSTVTQNLAGLTSFSATITPTGAVTSLSFTTVPAVGTNTTFAPNGFIVTTSGSDFEYSTTTTSTSYPGGTFTTGTLVQVVPEPAVLSAAPLAALPLLRRRRA